MDWLKNVPRWFLVVLVCLMTIPSGYALSTHLQTDTKQTTDIADLASTIQNLVVVVEHNYKTIEEGKEDRKEIKDILVNIQVAIARLQNK